MEELRRLSFEGVANELEKPAGQEQAQGQSPQAVNKQRQDENRKRQQNGWNAQRMASAIDGVLMTARVARDPLLAGMASQG